MTKSQDRRERVHLFPIWISLKADFHFFYFFSILFSFSSVPLPHSLVFASPFSRNVHTFFDDGLTLDLLQLESTTQQQTKDDEGLQWSEISLTLQPFHYTNGRLNLRCTAQIPGIYSVQSEVHLLTSMREPVPERGNYQNSTSTFCSIIP